MISTDISTSEKVESCSDFAQVLFDRMIAHQDEWGRMVGAPVQVKAKLKPLDRRSAPRFEKAIRELAAVGLICWYEVNGNTAIAMKPESFEEYQSSTHTKAVDSGRSSKFPAPPVPLFRWEEDGPISENPEVSGTVLDSPELYCHNLSKENLIQRKLNESSGAKRAPVPGVSEARAYFFGRLQKHTRLEQPEFPFARAGAFFKQRLTKGDDLSDLTETVDYFFDKYIRGDLSAANFAHYQRQYNALALAVQKQREAHANTPKAK